MLSPVAKPPGAVRDWNDVSCGVSQTPKGSAGLECCLEGLAKSSGVVVRAVHNGRAKSAVHFSCFGDVLVTCSGDVPAVFEQPLKYRRNVVETRCWKVA